MENAYLNPPKPEITNRVSNRIEELGIYYDQEMVAVIIAAYEDLLKNTFDMKTHLVEMLGFDWRRGESDKNYEITGHNGEPQKALNGSDIVFMQAVIAKSSFVNPRLVVEQEIELEGCDACGILSHCTKVIRNKATDKLERICNNCLVYDEQLRGEGDAARCEGCSKIMCEHHPKETRRFA